MKIFGKYGWFWYRGVIKMVDEKINVITALKREYYVLHLNYQISDDFFDRMLDGMLKKLGRLYRLRDYILKRKMRIK